MGASYRFTCTGCGYEACVSGGPDQGFLARTVTVVCLNCQEISDSDELEERQCGECGSRNVRLWTHPGACPQCGEMMARGEQPDLLWD